jgi:hypothetical protein
MKKEFALALLERIKWDMPNYGNGWNNGVDSIERMQRCIMLSDKPVNHRMMGAALVAASAGRRYSRILSNSKP